MSLEEVVVFYACFVARLPSDAALELWSQNLWEALGRDKRSQAQAN